MNNFTIFKDGWNNHDTICGWSSSLKHTQQILTDLPRVFDIVRKTTSQTKIKVNDAGCGDLSWITHLNPSVLKQIDYHGYDLYFRPLWNKTILPCSVLDICNTPMRKADLIICRDVFIHWPNTHILSALQLFKQTTKFLYTTTYTGEYYDFTNNNRITQCNLKHSKLNMCSHPFNLNQPIHMTSENYHTHYTHKLICLWKL